APASGGSTIQIGAFSSEAKAKAAWKTLSGRFSFLAGLTELVVPVQSGEKTLYRLRASGGNAGDICRRLRTAGESCSVVG
ncbi:MAG: SPOR domain-containing protein, partial [Rhizorhabdus sp.]